MIAKPRSGSVIENKQLRANNICFIIFILINKIEIDMAKPVLAILILLFGQKIWAQNPENWTSKQLMEPSELARQLKNTKEAPVIYSVGPGTIIPYSIAVGMTKEKNNLEEFRKRLKELPLNTKIVIYCGCCPFEHCPNVRPAIQVLKEMKFTNYYLLNLPHNIKADWLDKGYPSANK